METTLPNMTPLKELKAETIGSYTRGIIVTDPHIESLFSSWLKKWRASLPFPTGIIYVAEGEKGKSLEWANACWEQMHQEGLDRQSVVISIGGGSITDLGGFVASCYMRGIAAVHIPTTLMGMVDAAIGGKTAINFPKGKNLIGSFHAPSSIWISPDFLATLPDRHFLAGIAEVIKYGVIADSALFKTLDLHTDEILERDPQMLLHLIERSCTIKADIIKKDPYDKNERAFLNFGHTFAHALEVATGYETYLHGEAVAIGMSCASHVSVAAGLTPEISAQSVDQLCQKFGFELALPDSVSLDDLIELMVRDKKGVNGKIHLILVKEIGEVLQKADVSADLIEGVLKLCKKGHAWTN